MSDPVTVVAQQVGNCLQVHTTRAGFYGEWIKGEGGDICLYRSLPDQLGEGGGRLVGVNLPLYNWNGRIVSVSLVDDWKALGVDERLDTIYETADGLLRMGLFPVVDMALSLVDIEDIDATLAWLIATYPASDKLQSRQELFEAAKAKGYPVEGLEWPKQQ